MKISYQETTTDLAVRMIFIINLGVAISIPGCSTCLTFNLEKNSGCWMWRW